jgi:hypothetical protein
MNAALQSKETRVRAQLFLILERLYSSVFCYLTLFFYYQIALINGGRGI